MYEDNEMESTPQAPFHQSSLEQDEDESVLYERRIAPSSRTRAPEGEDIPPYYKPMAQATNGSYRYPSGEELSRPVDFPGKFKIILILFVIAGAVVGIMVFNQYYTNVIHGAEKQSAQVQANLTRGVALDLPVLTEYANLSDDEILVALQAKGYEIHDITAEGSSLDLVKSPSDISATEAALLLTAGISTLSAVDASKLLVGLWRLDTSRTDGYTIRVRYADFTSGDPDAAVAACLAAEGIDTSTVTEEGTDTSGNTYKTGTVSVDGVNYQWRASAIALKSVYDIGLPDSSMYVGFRLTQLA